MAAISPKEVEHVANLAHLALPPEELARVGHELNRILVYFQQLQELDTEQIESTSHAIAMENVYREDSSRESRGSRSYRQRRSLGPAGHRGLSGANC